MDVTFRELNNVLERHAKEKLPSMGFRKRKYHWAKEEGDSTCTLLYATYESYPGKEISFSFCFSNVRLAIASKFINYMLKNELHDYNFDRYDDTLFCYSQRILHYENILPTDCYHVCTVEEAEAAVQHGYELFFQTFLPFTERCKNIPVLEWELNEGEAWKWKTIGRGPVSPGLYAWGIVYAKMVSEARYLHIKEKFTNMMQAQESVLLDKDKEYWNLNLHYWYKALAYLDSTSTEALNKLTDELLVKYNAPAKPTKKRKSPSDKNKAKRKEKVMEEDNIITGFDSDGEPDLRMDEDGSLRLVFNFMPPLNGQEEPHDHPIFERFDEVLSRALGVEVLWEDREVFLITNPTDDTAQKIKAFLESFWEQLPTLEQDAEPPPPSPLPPPPTSESELPQEKKRKWWPFG